MNEKIITLNSTEKEALPNEEILSLVTYQRDDLVMTPELNLLPKKDEPNDMYCARLSSWARTSDLDSALDAAGYYEGEKTEAGNALLKLSLMTPNFIYTQEAKDQTRDKSLVKELVEYNEAVRETARLNPSLSAIDLAKTLQSSVLWADLPESYRYSSGNMIDQAINGARGELIMEQLACSEAAEAAGITYENTSTEEDIKGIDLRLNIPVKRDGKMVDVSLPVDVKFNMDQVLKLFNPGERPNVYKIQNERIVMWPGTSKEDLAGSLMLGQESAEDKGRKIVPILQEAAIIFHEHQHRHQRVARSVGHYGVRSA